MRILVGKTAIVAIVISGFVWSTTAEAVPSFARKHELNCSACHTAYPQLNATGRAFIEYLDRYNAPASAQEDSRVTIQVVAAF